MEFSEASAPAREAALRYMCQRRYAVDVYSEILDSNPDLADLLIGRTSNSYTGRGRTVGDIEERCEKRLNFLARRTLGQKSQSALHAKAP
eukprot:3208142-Pleurochrysis_carterae.AAC.1